jgi:hypothetical protein
VKKGDRVWLLAPASTDFYYGSHGSYGSSESIWTGTLTEDPNSEGRVWVSWDGRLNFYESIDRLLLVRNGLEVVFDYLANFKAVS